MSLLNLPSTLRSVNRLRTIVTVFSRHGFDALIYQLDLARLLPFRSWRRRAQPASQPSGRMVELSSSELWGEQLAAALEELGPTFIKLGQMLSSRPDVLPTAVVKRLRRLQDRVPPSDPTAVREHLARELGGPVEQYFHQFHWEPCGGGSIAQVHFATARDGQRVVVKVRRPGIDSTMAADGELLMLLASQLEKRIPESRVFRPVVIVEEFVRGCAEELDLIGEAANTARFLDAFRDHPHIVIPQVRWDLSRSGILTLSRLEGKNISRPEALTEFGVDRKLIANALLDAFVQQYFQMGIFHADPHPGNLMALGPARVGILDFGQVGHLSDDMRDRLITALLAALERELDVVVRVFAEMGSIDEATVIEDLKADLQKLLNKYHGLSLGNFAIDKVFDEIIALTRRHRVTLPRDFVMIIKSLATIGGVGMSLDPEMDLAGVLKPRLQKILWQKVQPGKLARRAAWGLYNLQHFLWEAPNQLGELLRRTNNNKMVLNLRVPSVDHLSADLDRTGNRLTLGIIIAAGLIGSSIMLAHQAPPLVTVPFTEQNASVFGLLGLLICAAGGLLLLRAMYQSGSLS